MDATSPPDVGVQKRPSIAIILLFIIIAYPVLKVLYNVYFHPLSKIRGPLLHSASRIPYVLSLLKGWSVQDFQKLHQRYGPIVRVAPNEVSIAQPEVWNDVFQLRQYNEAVRHHHEFLKDPVWWQPHASATGRVANILTAIDPEHHARLRKVIAPAFTSRALKAQESFAQRYVNLLVERVREAAIASEDEIDMKDWFIFTTFDIFGDLGFGESFNCLQDSRYHPWVARIFGSVKAVVWVVSTRYWPALHSLLLMCIPPSIQEMANEHRRQIEDKVRRRMNYEVERPDVFSPLMTARRDGKSNNKLVAMTMDEIDALFSSLVNAASETTATTLTGTLNCLVQNPSIRNILATEIRGTFDDQSEINIDALRDLPYLNQVLKEGLRLCTPVPWVLPRQTPPEGAIVCGTFLPGGTSISTQAYTMNRNPEYWHDAESFLPERWAPEALTDKDSPFYKDRRDGFQPFLVGSRACLGQHLAWAELWLITAKLIWNFDFEQSKDPERRLKWETQKTFMLVETQPVWVKVRPRALA
ncbi:cytochrome P450 [Rhypophila decipiens]|uniref:Cytochrome P450 n=1 Tax=Rhypophila decipiens TaxID=261697 RepID=A0AAN6XTA0_9PEZI|nr:cytochrome P450 [Rhypophila decipiens]